MASNYEMYDAGLKEGEILNNRFEIIKKIGQGGFGFVYIAHDNENRGEKSINLNSNNLISFKLISK